MSCSEQNKKAHSNLLIPGNETWGRCGMFSHSRREEIWLLRAPPACKTLSHRLTTQAELSEKNKWRHWFTSCLFTALSGEDINSPVEALFPHHTTQRDAWEEGWAGHTHTHRKTETHIHMSAHMHKHTRTSYIWINLQWASSQMPLNVAEGENHAGKRLPSE